LPETLRISEPPSLKITEHEPAVDVGILWRKLQRLLESLGCAGEVTRVQSTLSFPRELCYLLASRLGRRAQPKRKK
jgi:hypothetical protein